MYEYTKSFLSPFSWAQSAYNYMLGLDPSTSLTVSIDTLTSPSVSNLSPTIGTINTDSDWNKTSKSQISIIGAIYQSADQAEQYFNSLYSLLDSRLLESETRVKQLDSNLRVLISSSQRIASTSIDIKGGDTTSIETDNKWYRLFSPLAAIPDEGVFRLKDTGFFSSVRSLGGFAGNIIIEESLGQIVQSGGLSAMSDGDRTSFWMGTFYSPAPIRASQTDVPWLGVDYTQGYALQITYYMDRPTLATEVFIDPVITEPIDLVSISWTPSTIVNNLYNSSFTNGTSGWTRFGNITALSSGGINNSTCVMASNSSGWVSQTFALPGSYLSSGSTTLISTGRRAQLTYSIAGRGDCYGGARLIWLDALGRIINYKQKEDFQPGFFVGRRLVDTIPIGAASGMIQLGIFTAATTPSSGFINNASLLLGELNFNCNQSIQGPQTISLPQIVLSGRFTFVFAQRNPRREVLSKESATVGFTPITGQINIDPTLQNITQGLSDSLLNQGPGNSVFAYRLGLKELDLRYREHIPRGSFVTNPLYSTQEIRELWINAELGPNYNEGTTFYIYPFADDPNQKTAPIAPFLMGDIINGTGTSTTPGDVLKIVTFEEQSSGWFNINDKNYLVNPITVTEQFDGTDSNGSILLGNAPHLRRPYLNSLNSWLNDHSIWPTVFDPNASTLYGLPNDSTNQIIKDSIRQGNPTDLTLDDLISTPGYLPIKITVRTDQWIAHPDTYGRSDTTNVRTVIGEILTPTTQVLTSTNQTNQPISFDSWLNATTAKNLIDRQGLLGNLITALNVKGHESWSLNQILDSIVSSTNRTPAFGEFNKKRDLVGLQRVYNRLKQNGKLPLDNGQINKTTSAVEVVDVFATRFNPIITGPGGTFLKLYWYNPTAASFLIVPQSNYEVSDSNLGLVAVNTLAPSGFTSLIADYLYVSNSGTDDFLSSVITASTTPVSGTSDLEFQVNSRSLPATRNMTDYINGTVPTLKLPNFDRLSNSYYPYIEYYINNNGQISFARDFFRYGDIPAIILAEYDTLAISPRIAGEVIRTGSASSTPSIYNVSLRVREGSAALSKGAS